MTSASSETRIPLRSEMLPEQCWDLESVYPTPEHWETDFSRLGEFLAPVLAWRGKLDSPEALAAVFQAEDELSLLVERLYTYAHHREDEDTANTAHQARSRRVLARLAEIRGAVAWIEPEILAHPAETLEPWREETLLRPYRRTLDELLRKKPHILSEPEETLLSLASDIFRKPYEIFSALTNADLKFPDVADDQGNPRPLSNGRFITFLEHRDRAMRRRAFETFYNTYLGLRNTLTSTLASAIRTNNYTARIRRFPSALEAALHPDNVPARLYDTLAESVHEALPIFHEYIDLRKQMLGLDTLDMYDQYVPIVSGFDMKVDWPTACRWVRESCEPLGGDYRRGVEEAFSRRWIDVYENQGKRSGAYSGGCYGTHPFILMNYQGTLDHVFTLAHELGHSMHSRLANETQPYRYATYAIFAAEIASTTNEALLLHHLLQTTSDPRFRAYLLNHLCDQFRGTVFRQTQFAEFERLLHERDAAGEALTADSISEPYYALNAQYYGPSVRGDRRIAFEWMRIPHFYYNFYVYKYATGFCAAQVFARRILESPDGRDRYLDFLRGGGSADPLELIRRGGVDLLDREVLTGAFATFREAIAELRTLLATPETSGS